MTMFFVCFGQKKSRGFLHNIEGNPSSFCGQKYVEKISRFFSLSTNVIVLCKKWLLFVCLWPKKRSRGSLHNNTKVNPCSLWGQKYVEKINSYVRETQVQLATQWWLARIIMAALSQNLQELHQERETWHMDMTDWPEWRPERNVWKIDR